MYDQNSLVIALVLLIVMMITIELGYRVGTRRPQDEVARAHTTAIQGSLLGVLALLLAFTFSLSLQRYDTRTRAVVDEANAIGTTYLRAQLLPAALQDEGRRLIERYLDARVQASRVALTALQQRDPLLVEAERLRADLWSYALSAAEQDGRPVTSGLFIQSLNEMIDAWGVRDAALKQHVPEVVLFLLFIAFAMASWMLGYGPGIEGRRPPFATFLMAALIVVLVFIVIDLDRPRRGFIEVSQASMVELQTAIASSP